MPKTAHIHKLKRLKYKSGNTIFFCALPDCNFKTSTPLALGKRSLCWRCGNEFIMSDYSLRLAKPHCENCHKPKIEVIVTKDDISYKHPIEIKPGSSLAERLSQTIQQAKTTEEEEI